MTRHIEIWNHRGKYQVEVDTETGTEILMVLNNLSELEQLMNEATNMFELDKQTQRVSRLGGGRKNDHDGGQK